MLTHLSVSNYALIDRLEIDLSEGFTTITGETGAGKSILLGALSLILGERAESKVLQDPNRKCVVEAQFSIVNYPLKELFEEEDLDYFEESFIRREINPQGRSRAFINDTPVSLVQLKKIASRLVDIHSQHQSLLLNTHSFQLNMLDSFCAHEESLSAYQQTYKELTTVRERIKTLEEQASNQQAELDYKSFLWKELEEAQLASAHELEDISADLQLLENAEEIEQNLQLTKHILEEDEYSVISKLQELQKALSATAHKHPASEELLKRVESCSIELADIATESEQLGMGVEQNPERLHFLQERVDLLNRLLQKHQLSHLEQLIMLKDQLDKEINAVAEADHQLSSLKETEEQLFLKAEQLAQKLSSNRTEQIPAITNRLLELLATLGMPEANISILQERLDTLNKDGFDQLSFLFSANKGGSLQAIAKVASGGEISRLMLCIKFLMADKQQLPTIIFDEIDTGVSGEIADKMGQLMEKMSRSRQVLSITHLPQVAAKGKEQLLVQKDSSLEATHTQLRKLSKEERVQQLAQMLSGEVVTESALTHAKEMMAQA
jgi:DNA repair protein RecN (Recombination protein N)